MLDEANQYSQLYIGRVSTQAKNTYKIITENSELTAQVSGKFHYNIETLSDYPAVGDFVMLDRIDDKVVMELYTMN